MGSLVSVVMPVFNAENYIESCLDATIRQTYQDIEIIIIDDGSVDSTVEKCEEYRKKDNRIKIISTDNNGPSNARNVGIENANGDYIVFFDADDRPERDLIEWYMRALGQWNGKDISFILCGMYYDNLLNKNADDRIVILEAQYGFIPGENYLLKRNYAATLAWLKIFNFVTNKCYKLSEIKAHNIRFDEKVSIGEDLKFNLDYLDSCRGYIGMINAPLYHYIKRNKDSLSLSYHESDLEDTKEIYRRLLEWESRQNGVTEDNMAVLKSIFITDWTSRLTTIYDNARDNKRIHEVVGKLNKEVGSSEFQDMLKQIYKAHKISSVRYLALRTGRFLVFCYLREFYKFLKG